MYLNDGIFESRFRVFFLNPNLISALLLYASMLAPSQRTKQSVDGPWKDHFLFVAFFFSFCDYVCWTDTAVVCVCVCLRALFYSVICFNDQQCFFAVASTFGRCLSVFSG